VPVSFDRFCVNTHTQFSPGLTLFVIESQAELDAVRQTMPADGPALGGAYELPVTSETTNAVMQCRFVAKVQINC